MIDTIIQMTADEQIIIVVSVFIGIIIGFVLGEVI